MAKRGNGEGSIRKRPDGTWEGRYTAGRNYETGKLIPKSVYGKTRADCKKKLDEALKRIESGAYISDESLTVSVWIKHYLWDIKRSQIKPTTFGNYEINIRNWISPSAIYRMKVKDVRRRHIQEFIDGMVKDGATPFAIRNVYGVLRGAFSEAEKREIVPVSPAKFADLPKRHPKPVAVLTIEQQKIFLDSLKGHRLKAAFIIAATTGIRAGELAALTWDDYKDSSISINKNAVRVNVYDDDTGKITGSEVIIQDTPKTAAGVRTIPLMPVAIKALHTHKKAQNDERVKNRRLYKKTGLMFCNEIGAIYEPKYYLHAFYKLLDAAGLPRIKFHALRHTFATRGLEMGLSPKELQELLGHETPEMTMHYQHMLDSQKRAAIDKISKAFEQQSG